MAQPPSTLSDDPGQAATTPRRSLRLSTAPAFGSRFGLAIVALGLLVIGLGWNGASGRGGFVNGATDVRGQIPWLLSGGFLGLGLVVLGCTIALVQAMRADRTRLEDLIHTELSRLTDSVSGTVASTNTEGMVIAGAASFHRPECRLAPRDAQWMDPHAALGAGLSACRVCKPGG